MASPSKSSDDGQRRKRSLSTDEVDVLSEAKRPKINAIKLLDLSDDVILEIFSYLNTADLINLMQTHTRLSKIASDKSLWRKVDTRAHPLSVVEFRQLLKVIHSKTKSIIIGGFLKQRHRMHHESVTAAILETITAKCPNLESFELAHCFLDAAKIKITQFPASVRHFGLTDCELINLPTTESYLKTMHTHFTDLESLDLSSSTWLPNHSLNAICKCEKLLKLNLKGCRRMGECFAYTALATRFGFRQTRWMDLRDTCFGDSEVGCFARLPEIRTLLLGQTSAEDFVPPAESEGRGIITDHGVSSILPSAGDHHLVKLEELSLTDTDITEQSVARLLRSMPTLKILDVRRCSKLLSNQVESLRGLRPTCKVIFDTPEE